MKKRTLHGIVAVLICIVIILLVTVKRDMDKSSNDNSPYFYTVTGVVQIAQMPCPMFGDTEEQALESCKDLPMQFALQLASGTVLRLWGQPNGYQTDKIIIGCYTGADTVVEADSFDQYNKSVDGELRDEAIISHISYRLSPALSGALVKALITTPAFAAGSGITLIDRGHDSCFGVSILYSLKVMQ